MEQGASRGALSSIGWSSVGTAAAFVANFVTLIVLARLLLPVDFGVAAAALAIITILRIGTFSVGQAVVQCTPFDEEDVRTAVTLAMSVGLASTAVAIGAAPALEEVLGVPRLAGALMALSPILMLRGIAVVPQAVLQRALGFRLLSTIEAGSFLLGYAVVAILLAERGLGLWALVLATVAQSAIEAVSLFTFGGRPRPGRPRSDRMRRLLRPAGGFGASVMANVLATNSDNLIVAASLGPAPLGLYTRAYRLAVTPANLYSDAVDTALYPVMVTIRDQPDRLLIGLRRGLVLVALVMLPVSAVCFSLSEQIVFVLLGSNWDGAVPVFRLLSVGMFFRVSGKPPAAVLKATGAVGNLAACQIGYAAMVIVGAGIGQFWGLSGVATGVAVAIVLTFGVMLRTACKAIGGSVRGIVRDLSAAAVVAAVAGWSAWLASRALVRWGSPPWAILTLCGGLALLGVALAASPLAGIFGPEGRWWHDRGRDFIQRFLRRIMSGTGGVRNAPPSDATDGPASSTPDMEA